MIFFYLLYLNTFFYTFQCNSIYCDLITQYGWLASKAEFRLEKYGSFIVKYPIKDITLIRGNIPTLAAGKNFVFESPKKFQF